MDSSPTFTKQKYVTVSRSVAALVALIFIIAITGTGLIVYHLSACELPPEEESSSVLIFDSNISGSVTEKVDVEFNDSDNVTITTTESTQQVQTGEATEDLRLPKSLVPHSYNVKLIAFIEEGNFTFHGDVTILINVSASSENITLHAQDLIAESVQVLSPSNNKIVAIKDVANDTKRQFLIIHLSEPVETGLVYEVRIKFRGILNDFMQGFYRSSYKVQNETRWLAATQFQPTDARRAFPCFDEPALKAKFKISIGRPRNLNTISNMPKEGASKAVAGLPNYEWDHFQESVPMSTYLVAFVVSDFERISNGTFSVWARKEAISQTKYALEIGPLVLKYYESFFGIKYPLPKLDMIALPDFSAGAMENWGLITYRESTLLYEENTSSKYSQENVAHVITHELAHQWFGNLVTPNWWTDIWLNEGFATYMEYIGANYINPAWKELDQFLINDLFPVFILDSLKSSHQISIKVNNPDEINDIFDRISYSKGASVLRMLQEFLSLQVFQEGLTSYLKSKLYQNADEDDLWKSLTQESRRKNKIPENVTINEIMNSWTLQTGLPVVTVTRDYKKSSVTLHQERFLVSIKDKNKTSTLWWIPITYTDSSLDVKTLWMNAVPEVSIDKIATGKDAWLLVNVNQTGYYRVNYDAKNWALIIKQLQKHKGHLDFDPKNRAQIINDAFNLASVGLLNYTTALNLSQYMIQETELIPWKTLLVNTDHLYDMFVRTSHFHKFQNYLLHLLTNIYKSLGFSQRTSDSVLDIYNRMEIVSRACKLGVRNCIVSAYQHFQTWKNSVHPDNINPIPVDLREVVYCTAISLGGQEEWDFAWQRYLNANVETEKEILLTAMGCSKEIWILSRFLEWAVTENTGIRKQDAARVFMAVTSNPIGQDLSYRFVKTNWIKLKNYFGSTSPSLSTILKSCTKKFNTEAEVEDLKMFVDKHKDELGAAFRAAQQTIEQGTANVEWMSNYSPQIIQWLTLAQF